MSDRKGKWASNLEYVCSCIGYSVGLGNLWRFPYVAYKHGGSAFLLPYVIINLLIGRPIYYLELLMGQFCGRGPLGVFRMSPMFQAGVVRPNVFLILNGLTIRLNVFITGDGSSVDRWQLSPPPVALSTASGGDN
ncbi:hypothetical protein HPB50_019278 [Hyalomma asiaticum]|uniref:Uncharacterized protein n=1 Tax=Hyalomma asiaticum TaxID=266040 RepID=A0ACB7RVU3_HYAAI|nr:hypothetical protein HPB50_019278 [Hyalomma asiaticum]